MAAALSNAFATSGLPNPHYRMGLLPSETRLAPEAFAVRSPHTAPARQAGVAVTRPRAPAPPVLPNITAERDAAAMVADARWAVLRSVAALMAEEPSLSYEEALRRIAGDEEFWSRLGPI